MNNSSEPTKNPRVFISYSWDSPEHKSWVKSLATQLRQDGIDVRLDDWHLRGRTIPSFMTSEVRNADFILAICTPRFREKVHATEDDTNTTGSGWETQIASSIQFNDNRNRMVPLLASGTWNEAAPDVIIGLAYFDFSNEDVVGKSYKALLLRLLGRESAAPPLGVPPDIAGEVAEPLLKRSVRQAPVTSNEEPVDVSGSRWPVWAGAFVALSLLVLFGYFWQQNSVATGQFEALSATCQRQVLSWCPTESHDLVKRIQAQIKPAGQPDDEYRDVLFVSYSEKWQPHSAEEPRIVSPLPVGPAVISLEMARRLPWVWRSHERTINCEVRIGEESCP